MAGTTGLEPATSAVTGQHSNQLNYVPLPWRLASQSLALCGLNCSSLPDYALQGSTELSPFRTWIVAKKAGFVTAG